LPATGNGPEEKGGIGMEAGLGMGIFAILIAIFAPFIWFFQNQKKREEVKK